MICLKNFTGLDENEILRVYEARTDERTTKYLFTSGFSLESHKRFIESLRDDPSRRYFMVLEDGEFLGVISFIDITRESAEFGLYKNPEVARAGSKLMRETLRYASEELNLKYLVARVKKDNAKALALYEKFGFIAKKEENQIVYIEKIIARGGARSGVQI